MGRKANLDKDEVIPEGKKKKKKRQGARRLMKCQAVKDHSEHWQKKKTQNTPNQKNPENPTQPNNLKIVILLYEDLNVLLFLSQVTEKYL